MGGRNEIVLILEEAVEDRHGSRGRQLQLRLRYELAKVLWRKRSHAVSPSELLDSMQDHRLLGSGGADDLLHDRPGGVDASSEEPHQVIRRNDGELQQHAVLMSAELGDESALFLGRPRLVESAAVDGDDVGVTLVVIEIRDVPHGIARELGRQLVVPSPWCRAWGNHRVPSATDLVENRAQRRAALAWWLGIHGFSLAPRPAVEFASCADSSLSSPSPPSPPPRSLIPSPPATQGMDRITEPQPSPQGDRVAFVVRTTDFEANRGRTDLWLVNIDGSGLTRLT